MYIFDIHPRVRASLGGFPVTEQEARDALAADVERRKALQARGRLAAATLARDSRGRFLARNSRVENDVSAPLCATYQATADWFEPKPQTPQMAEKAREELALRQTMSASTNRPCCTGCDGPVQDRAYRLCRDCAEDVAFVAAKPMPSLWQRILQTLGW